MPDGLEHSVGADPLNEDTDGDGILDGPDGTGDDDEDGIINVLDPTDDRPGEEPPSELEVSDSPYDTLAGGIGGCDCTLSGDRGSPGSAGGWTLLSLLMLGATGLRRRRSGT